MKERPGYQHKIQKFTSQKQKAYRHLPPNTLMLQNAYNKGSHTEGSCFFLYVALVYVGLELFLARNTTHRHTNSQVALCIPKVFARRVQLFVSQHCMCTTHGPHIHMHFIFVCTVDITQTFSRRDFSRESAHACSDMKTYMSLNMQCIHLHTHKHSKNCVHAKSTLVQSP
jgi:hypothetical protein